VLATLIALGIFGTVLLLLEGSYYIYRTIAHKKTEKVIERLQAWSVGRQIQNQIIEGGIVRKDVVSEIPWLNDFLMGLKQVNSIRTMHAKARAKLPLGGFLILSGFLGSVFGLVSAHLGAHFLIALICGGAGASIPVLYLWRKMTKRIAEFHRQLPEALELIARALHSGHAFFVGMKLVGEEFADPIGTEFKQAFSEVSMGLSVPEALQNLANRVDCVDMKFFVTSVNLQRETGGNLAEIIESLSDLIRKRFELLMKVKVLSAEGRFSALVLFALPFGFGGLIFKTNPEYIKLLFTDPIGQGMLAVGATLMIVGGIVTKRMITIEV
jgi:tight adherence protein B